jgi:hypothetical protein
MPILYHYSPHKGLKEIDPLHYGTSGKDISLEYKQGIKHLVPRSYHYESDQPEGVIANDRHRYEVYMPDDHKIYDLGHDPEGIAQKVHKQSGLVGPGLYDLIEHEIKSSGYHGYKNSKSTLPHVIAHFHKLDIHDPHPHPHSYDWHDHDEEEVIDFNKDEISGGLADKKKPSDFDKDSLKQGIKVEMEHTDNPKIALEIAMDHLTEDKNYYTKLKTIEKGKLSKATHPHLQAHGPTPQPEVNEQAGGVTMDTFHPIMSNFGTITPGKKTNLKHYQDLDHHHDNILDQVKGHGYTPYFAGGKHGKPDLANKNYNTNHLMIYDPTPQSGGDFGNEKYTSAWRHSHELAHALTYPKINKLYGEERRLGRLGVRTPNAMKRAVHWEFEAAHKQRELMENLGYKVSDEDFHKELNTVLGDATHRAITGKFTEPSDMGFAPHSHKPDLKMVLGLIDEHAKKLGLEHDHDTLADLKARRGSLT